MFLSNFGTILQSFLPTPSPFYYTYNNKNIHLQTCNCLNTVPQKILISKFLEINNIINNIDVIMTWFDISDYSRFLKMCYCLSVHLKIKRMKVYLLSLVKFLLWFQCQSWSSNLERTLLNLENKKIIFVNKMGLICKKNYR